MLKYAKVLRSGECSLLTWMQNLGSQPVFGVGSARWPDSPPQSGVAHGFDLIPVSGVGVVVDEIKKEGNAENSGTPRTHMVRGWDDFGET